METKEIKITVPACMEIDKENSTFECIKFKKIEQKKWRDTNPHVSGFYLSSRRVSFYDVSDCHWEEDISLFATEKQAKSALAMAQISQIMANDERFGGVVTDEEWCNTDCKKSVIRRAGDMWVRDFFTRHYHFLAFHTTQQRDLFLQENEDLVKDYLMLD